MIRRRPQQQQQPLASGDVWSDRPSGLRSTQVDDSQERARLGPIGEGMLRELRVTPAAYRHDVRFWLAMAPALLVALSLGGELTLYASVLMLLFLYALDRIGERVACVFGFCCASLRSPRS